jgi:hypothetical protein
MGRSQGEAYASPGRTHVSSSKGSLIDLLLLSLFLLLLCLLFQ